MAAKHNFRKLTVWEFLKQNQEPREQRAENREQRTESREHKVEC